MNIGQAARASGVSAKLIRYYEQIGLIQATGRTGGNYRNFGERELNELRFIKRARMLGYSVEDIRGLLGLWRDPTLTSGQVKAVVEDHLADLETRIAEMQGMADTLRELSEHHGEEVRSEFPSLAKPAPPALPKDAPPASTTKPRRPRK